MAFSATNINVCTFQDVPGLVVVKGILSTLEVYQFVVASMMLNVAMFAFIILRLAVQSASLGLPCFYRGMALETLYRELTAVGGMTFLAVADPFKEGVRAMQLSRRQLGRYRSYDQ